MYQVGIYDGPKVTALDVDADSYEVKENGHLVLKKGNARMAQFAEWKFVVKK